MGKLYIVVLLLLFLSTSCTTGNDIEKEDYSDAKDLKITSIDFNGNEITINWQYDIDAENDSVFYELYIDSGLIDELNETSSTLDLEYNTDYVGKIIAKKKENIVSELDFSFSTPISELLFFSDHYGDLTAYDLLTNTILWKTKTNATEVHSIYNDMIFSGIGSINAFNIFTGDLVWTSNPSPNYGKIYTDILVDDTHIYAFDSDSNLHCVAIVSEDIVWDNSFLNHTATLAIDDTRLYVTTTDTDHLYALNKNTGMADWSFHLNTATSINVNPLVTDSSIYIGDNLGIFYSIDKVTGLENWNIDSGTSTAFSVSPVLVDNLVIIGTINNLFAYDKDSGVLQWTYTPVGTLETSPFIYNTDAYLAVSDNINSQLVCLNTLDGTLKWSFNLTNDSQSSPIVYNDVVYSNDLNKKLHAINANTSALNWRIKTNGIVTQSPTIVKGLGDEVIYPSTHGLNN